MDHNWYDPRYRAACDRLDTYDTGANPRHYIYPAGELPCGDAPSICVVYGWWGGKVQIESVVEVDTDESYELTTAEQDWIEDDLTRALVREMM